MTAISILPSPWQLFIQSNENVSSIPPQTKAIPLHLLIKANNEILYKNDRKNEVKFKFVKYTAGRPIESQCQKLIVNVAARFRGLYPRWTCKQITKFTSKVTGIGTTSISIIERKMGKYGLSSLKTPGKHRDMSSRRRVVIYDKFVQDAIRKKVYDSFRKREVLLLSELNDGIQKDKALPHIGCQSLRLLMHDIGFKSMRRKRDAAIIETNEILSSRYRYLRQIRDSRDFGKKIYYLGMTSLHAGENAEIEWTDATHTIAIKRPTAKDKKLIVGHVGSATGFVENSLLVFNAKKHNSDYLSEMNETNFAVWMEKVLPNLERNSVFVVEDAPYNSTKIDTAPTSSWLKSDIREWCVKNSAYFEDDYLKCELLDVVDACKDKSTKPTFDARCLEFGVSVIRLPRHHTRLNPIEMVWNQIKRDTWAHNTTFTVDEMENLLGEALKMITPSHWSNYASLITQEEQKYWELDNLIDETIDDFVADTEDESSDTDFSDSESISDAQP